MRKLYIQQKVFSGIDRFTVKDQEENDQYLVEGDFVQVGGKKLHIKDLSGEEVAMVQEKVLSLMPKFFVFRNGTQVAQIARKFALFGAKYSIEGPGWDVKGKIFQHDYTIMSGGKEIVSLHKAWLSWGDSYELDIADDADEILALAVVLAIDMVLEAQASARETSDI